MTHHFRLNRAGEFHNINVAFSQTHTLKSERWQGLDVRERPQGLTHELLNTLIEYRIPDSMVELEKQIKPNLPWAEDHFQERVAGEPLNPPPSNKWWPFAQQAHAEHVDENGMFSHTYPERMWPKEAGLMDLEEDAHHGIRYYYGDLEDVVQQLKKDPSTRQAYLPIWFPEDTGAVEGQRVPCTLGYHFLIRQRALQVTYFIRSCDYMRHFRDDVYMASRLGQWMVERFNEDAPTDGLIQTGNLLMYIVSFHIFDGDMPMIHHQIQEHQKTGGLNLSALL